MTKNKLKFAYISDDRARKATYNKRKKGIIKKVTELTILCGIPACAVISDPFDSQTVFWPNREGVNKVVEKYQNSSVKDETKNMNQESFIMQMITKARDKLRNLQNNNCEKELTRLMFEYIQNNNLSDDLTIEELEEFDKLVEKKLNELDAEMNNLN